MFDLELSYVVDEWAMDVARTIENKYGNSQGVEGNAMASSDLPFISEGNVVTYIRAQGQKAWILEYGSGSKSDQENPGLDAYVGNKNFNRYRSRSDMRIRGRDAGDYKDLDGNPQVSSGKNAGRDLEAKPVYEPQIPLHVVQEEIQKALPDLRSRLATVIPELIARELRISMEVVL